MSPQPDTSTTESAYRVAYLGPAGTFTEAAVRQFEDAGAFPGAVQLDSCSSPGEALDKVRAGYVDAAVVAIENSVDGPVTPTLDALAKGEVQIFGETELDIAFAIMVRPGTKAADVESFSTHPVAHQQVQGWMQEHMPRARFIAASSNAAAAQAVAEGEADAAAAPLRAAELFGLEVLADKVADVGNARTRFVLVRLAADPAPRSGHDRTALVFRLPNEPGSLVGALNEFAVRGVDMSRIGSRPTRRERYTYDFHVDLVGHIEDQDVAEAIDAVAARAQQLIYLGSWPIGDTQ